MFLCLRSGKGKLAWEVTAHRLECGLVRKMASSIDKSSLLELLHLSSGTQSEGGWQGSCDGRVPPPFGKRTWPSVKAFNESTMDRWFEDPQTTQKKASKANAIRLHRRLVQKMAHKRATEIEPPVIMYEKHLASEHGKSLGRALARGTAYPGCTIGGRPSTRESKDHARIAKLEVRKDILPNMATKIDIDFHHTRLG